MSGAASPTMHTIDLLREISDAHPLVAFGWHVAILVGVAWFVIAPPTTDRAVLFSLSPLLSVFLASAGHASWFDAVSFAALFTTLAMSRQNLAPRWRSKVPRWSTACGIALVVLGAWYPVFTDVHSLFTSPIGLLPAPTLMVVAGLTFLAGGFGSSVIPQWLSLWTAFYGTLGATRFGIQLDIGLLVASVGLVGLAMRNPCDDCARRQPSR